MGNCPDDRRILHIVAQTAPAARNRTGPGQDAELSARSPCRRRGAIKTASRRAVPPQMHPGLPGNSPISWATPQTCPAECAAPIGSGHGISARTVRCARKRTSDVPFPPGKAVPLSAPDACSRTRAYTIVLPPRPDPTPTLFRFDEYDNDALLGHGNPPSFSMPARALLRPPSGSRSGGTRGNARKASRMTER